MKCRCTVRSAQVHPKCQYLDTVRSVNLNRHSWPVAHFILEVGLVLYVKSMHCHLVIVQVEFHAWPTTALGRCPSVALPLDSHVALNYAPYPHGYFSGTELRLNLPDSFPQSLSQYVKKLTHYVKLA